jgi:hypothetical protein
MEVLISITIWATDPSGQVAVILEVVEEETPEDASGQVADILDVVEEEPPEGYSVPLPSPQIFFLQTE